MGGEGYSAVLIGATGATGRYLFAELVKNKEFASIVTLGRRKADLPSKFEDVDLQKEEESGRVVQKVIDMDKDLTTESLGEDLKGKDVFFSCFGTSKAQAGSAEEFTRIDYGYNYALATLAKESQVKHFSLLSSAKANKDSWFLYFNSKGKLEHDVEALGFQSLSIFRPGILDRKEKKRFAEKVGGWFIGQIDVRVVAQAMVNDSLKKLVSNASGKSLFHNQEIHSLADEK